MTCNYFIIPGIRRSKALSLDDIIQVVLTYTGLTLEDITKKSRKRERVFARHLIFFFARRKTSITLKDIGRPFGTQDHTTVIHGYQTIERYLYIKDELTCKAVEEIEKFLK